MGLARNYVKMMRVEDWIFGYFFIPIIGSIAATGLSEYLLWTALVAFCTIAFGFVVNNFADIEIDRCHSCKQKTNKNPLVSNTVSVNGTWLLMALLVAIPLTICLFLSLPAFFFTACALVLLLAYSLPPIRSKERYIADIATHGLMFGAFPFLIGYTLLAPGIALFDVRPLALCALFTIIGCLALIVHQMSDYAEDLNCSPTTIVRIGKQQGWRIFAVFFGLALISLWIVCLLLNLPAFMLYGSIALFVIPIYTLKDSMQTDY